MDDIANVGLSSPETEIEITPEMVKAGASVLYGMELDFAREEFWAKEVYRAMASVAPCSPLSRVVSAEAALESPAFPPE